MPRAGDGPGERSLRLAPRNSPFYTPPVTTPHPLPLPERALEIYRRLIACSGKPSPNRQHADPLAELVQTILSQNTSDLNSERAFASLMARFESFERVAAAPVEAIADAIRLGGLARVKAPRIKQVLEHIQAERGCIDLEFLRAMDTAAARDFLTSLPGVGPKTAACVLLFALGKPAIPVDTHVHRVSQRLGLIGPRVPAEQAEALLEQLVPPETYYAFHMSLIRHGRQLCKAPRPRCDRCPLDDLCPKVGLRTECSGLRTER
ncbi:MAG: endonuclease III [Chloroflexi bacterium]|nr:endonuclease III [Chloroflexota bacterium]